MKKCIMLTEKQAERLGVPHLAWKLVDTIMYEHDEKPEELEDDRMVKDIFYEGELIGGILDLWE